MVFRSIKDDYLRGWIKVQFAESSAHYCGAVINRSLFVLVAVIDVERIFVSLTPPLGYDHPPYSPRGVMPLEVCISDTGSASKYHNPRDKKDCTENPDWK